MALTEELQAEYNECFTILDKNSDGFLSNDEVKNIITQCQPAMDEEEMTAFMTDGAVGAKIDCPNFTQAMIKKMTTTHTESDLIDAFKVFDPQASGSIGFEEFEMLFKVLGQELITEEHREVLLKKCVTDDAPDKIKYEDFVKKMLSETMTPA